MDEADGLGGLDDLQRVDWVSATNLEISEYTNLICSEISNTPCRPTIMPIKSVIDSDGATCRNSNHFEHRTISNAP